MSTRGVVLDPRRSAEGPGAIPPGRVGAPGVRPAVPGGVEASGDRSDAIDVLVAAPDQLVRTGLAMLVGAQPGLRVVGVAGGGIETARGAEDGRPDVVLLDIALILDPGGIEVVGRIIDAGPRVVALASRCDGAGVRAALLAGVRGYLLKDAAPPELAMALRAVAGGGVWLDPTVAGDLLPELLRLNTAMAAPERSGAPELTCREREVLRLIAHGLSNGEIATHLMVAETTVKTHVGRIFGKLRLRDRAQAVAAAYRRQILAADDPLPPRAGVH